MPTTKGVKITEAARDILAAYHQPMLEPLSDKQQQQLVSLLATLHQYACRPSNFAACGQLWPSQNKNFPV